MNIDIAVSYIWCLIFYIRYMKLMTIIKYTDNMGSYQTGSQYIYRTWRSMGPYLCILAYPLFSWTVFFWNQCKSSEMLGLLLSDNYNWLYRYNRYRGSFPQSCTARQCVPSTYAFWKITFYPKMCFTSLKVHTNRKQKA